MTGRGGGPPERPGQGGRSGKPRRDFTPRQGDMPRQGDAPRRDDRPKRDFVPRQGDMPRQGGAPRRDDRPKRDFAPRRGDTPRRDFTPRQGDTPRRDDSPKRDFAPRQTDAPRRDFAPRQGDAPRRDFAPRQGDAPRRDFTPRQGDTPRRDDRPKRDFAPRQGDAPRRDFAPRQGDAPRRGDAEKRDTPRAVALAVLQDVSRSDAYAALALSRRLREARLSHRDKALASELAYGTLEWRLALDYQLDKRLERPGDIEPLVRDILRMGAYQCLYLDRVPDSAAVDESVKLCRMLGREPFAGLVNGVLRGLSRDKEAGALTWPGPGEDPALRLSVTSSLPLWIAARLIGAYGFEEAEAIAAFRPQKRTVTLRRTPDRLSPADFEALMTQKGWNWTPGRVSDAYEVSGIGDVGLDKDFLQGLYSVQGEGSMLAALAVAPRRGQSVLDACAAPGGKTACLAQQMAGTGRVYAWDVHEHRVELLRAMAKRLKLDNVRPAVRDASVVKEDLSQTMDAVLVDAPCSGLGVMLAKPDVKYRQTPEAVASLVKAQAQLLDACCRYVKPGGVLVYATCTLLPEENGEQVLAFLLRHPEFEPDGDGLAQALPAFARERAEDGRVQLLPHRDGTEGFFIARLRRRRA